MKVLSDIALNIVASIMPIGLLQFILLPLVANEISADSYGQLLTAIGLTSLSASTLGSVLNNVRLLNFLRYDELKTKGDFNILLLRFNILNIVIMVLGIFILQLNHGSILILLIASSILLLIDYGRVEFRIDLKYRNILFDSLWMLLGYALGFILFKFSGYWEFIFLCGYAASFFYIFSNSTIYKDPFRRTHLYKSITAQTITLMISGLLLGTVTYVDRLLLYPLLGGEAVSVYFVSTILGKTIFLVIHPIAGVLLSYLARMQQLKSKYFTTIVLTALPVGITGYIVIVIISKPLLSILYPTLVDQAAPYIKITTIAAIITLICNLINPVILRFCHIKWQIVINATYLVSYIVCSLLLLEGYGLMGFCIGVVIASVVNLIAMLLIYYLLNVKDRVAQVT